MAVVGIGILSEFNPSLDDWVGICERLDEYFITNGIDGADDAPRRRAILLTGCGYQTYSLMKDLLSPTKPHDKSYAALVELIQWHYKPKPEQIMLRYKFYTHQRSEGQLASEFVADLRHLASRCDFGTRLDEMLRDFFVIQGINSDSIT